MKKKLLAILGGPHENGSTAAMLDCALKAAAKSGWDISVIHLCQLRLAPCTGCRTCIQTGECVIDDDIKQTAKLLKSCDRVILSAPTYWANVPANTKNMFDRLLGTAMGESSSIPRPRLSRRQEYLLFTACNTPFPFSWLFGQSTGALRAMNEFFKTSGMKRRGTVVFSNAHGKRDLPAGVVKKIQRFF